MASKAATSAAVSAQLTESAEIPASEYRYQVEIAQMMFVFGDVVDPHPDVTKLVEDIVRNQVIEMIIQSRRLAQRRGSKYLASEDLIFLIRYDRAKVNRLRTYLSWKDVRKNAKDSGDGPAGGGGGGGADVDGLDDAGAMDNPMKATKMKIRLPWEISSIYSEYLRPLNGDEAEEEDEDDIEAHEDSMQRLKDADEATRRMTREEYVHYSECRQASFTFRKGKKFREFINAGAYLDVKPNDDIIDILGFLAFEVVRELCVGAVAIKKTLEEQDRARQRIEQGHMQASARADEDEQGDTSIETAKGSDSNANGVKNSPRKRKSPDTTADAEGPNSKRGRGGDEEGKDGEENTELCGLFNLPPTVEKPLKASHIQEAFAKLQRGRAALSSGMSGGPGGLRRTRVFVI